MKITLVGPAEPSEVLRGQYMGSVPLGLGGGVGGIPVNALARAHAGVSHRVTLVTGSPFVSDVWDSSGDDSSAAIRVIVVPFRQGDRVRLADLYRVERLRLAEVISGLQSDVIHAQWTYEFAWASLKANRAALITARDDPWGLLAATWRPGLAARLAMAARVRSLTTMLSASSRAVASAWRTKMRWSGEIGVVPNIVDLPPEASPGDPMNMVFVGHPGPAKNLAVLLAAWPLVRSRLPQATLTLVGSGLTPDFIANGRSSADIRGITALGALPHDDTLKVIYEAGMLIHPSRSEGFGNVVAEAMAGKTLVLASLAVPQMRSLLDSGRCGHLEDTSNATSLADAIVRAATDVRSRRALIEKAREKVSRLYSPDVVQRSWEHLYTEAGAQSP